MACMLPTAGSLSCLGEEKRVDCCKHRCWPVQVSGQATVGHVCWIDKNKVWIQVHDEILESFPSPRHRSINTFTRTMTQHCVIYISSSRSPSFAARFVSCWFSRSGGWSSNGAVLLVEGLFHTAHIGLGNDTVIHLMFVCEPVEP